MTTTSGVSSNTPVYGPVGNLTTSGTSQTSSSDSTAKAKKSNEIDKDMFLKLLVAQMKYQDPSNPTDPSTFLAQTAQFTTVEKLNSLETLGRRQTATSMMGQTVTYTGEDGAKHTGVVSGVNLGTSSPSLTIGGKKIALDDVAVVGSAPNAANSGTGSGTTT